MLEFGNESRYLLLDGRNWEMVQLTNHWHCRFSNTTCKKTHYTRNVDTASSVRAVKYSVYLFGAPTQLIADQGRCFARHEFWDICNSNNIKLRLTATESSRVNGQVERIMPLKVYRWLTEEDAWRSVGCQRVGWSKWWSSIWSTWHIAWLSSVTLDGGVTWALDGVPRGDNARWRHWSLMSSMDAGSDNARWRHCWFMCSMEARSCNARGRHCLFVCSMEALVA